MKAAIAVLLTVFVCCVLCEDCPNNNPATDCTHLSCGSGLQKSCVQNICTCTATTNNGCTTQSDCINNAGDCNRQWHCVDNVCRCGGNFGRR